MTVFGRSFARVVFAAVKSTTAQTPGAGSNGNGPSSSPIGDGERDMGGINKERYKKEDTAMRDSFFGLATNKKRVRPAKWPSKQLANRLVGLYFGHANPQLPILHKGEFETMMDQVYSNMRLEKLRHGRNGFGAPEENQRKKVGARELYMLNIVFAIGAGIFLEKDTSSSSSSGISDNDEAGRQRRKKKGRGKPQNFGGTPSARSPGNGDNAPSPRTTTTKTRFDANEDAAVKRESPQTINGMDVSENEEDEIEEERIEIEREERQYAPEAYHAAALPYLEAFLSSESNGGLDELQAVLLLAGYALLRPVAPGLWYIVGVAVRLAVDLGLHFEDSNASATESGPSGAPVDREAERLRGRREWVRDLRRRLWWCTYSLDRLVSTCVGRPFGIQDEVVSTRVSVHRQTHLLLPAYLTLRLLFP